MIVKLDRVMLKLKIVVGLIFSVLVFYGFFVLSSLEVLFVTIQSSSSLLSLFYFGFYYPLFTS